ncbi:hypothetical protein HOLleu_36922 [Holothuria leucospilota]|uniref:Uncharacterized protein n=1 Tax=Holothuria leucospilota TaxID=206669 RepID=A0A9Q1BGE3_HOLLE|nr:hypothetical protein HOLleu_36922 [Holothuria leucospilota]
MFIFKNAVGSVQLTNTPLEENCIVRKISVGQEFTTGGVKSTKEERNKSTNMLKSDFIIHYFNLGTTFACSCTEHGNILLQIFPKRVVFLCLLLYIIVVT